MNSSDHNNTTKEGNEMLPTNLINEAIESIKSASGSTPEMIDTNIRCIERLSSEFGMTMEKVSESLYVSRDQEEDGSKFDFWMFCKYGDKHTGQTITAVTFK